MDPARQPHGARALWQALASGNPVSAEPGWDGFPIRGCFADAVAWVALGLARALEYVHSLGILYGDIKPANVLLTLHDGPQLLDFGLARALDSVESTDKALFGGTLPYMAPFAAPRQSLTFPQLALTSRMDLLVGRVERDCQREGPRPQRLGWDRVVISHHRSSGFVQEWL